MLWLACAQEGAGQSLPVLPQREGRGEGSACQCISKEPFMAVPCVPATPPFPKITFSPSLQNPTFPVWAESLHWSYMSFLLSHDSNLLNKTTCWRPPSFLGGSLILQDPLMQAKTQEEASLHATASLPVAASHIAAAALASKAFKFSQLRSLPSLRSFFLFFENKLKVELLWMCVFLFIVSL